jgi:hypothetical protein
VNLQRNRPNFVVTATIRFRQGRSFLRFLRRTRPFCVTEKACKTKELPILSFPGRTLTPRTTTMKATEVTRRYHDAWNGRDAEALVAAFAEDGKFCNPDTYPGVSEEALGAYVKRTVDSFSRLSYRVAQCR